MKHYVLIESNSGYVWEEADAESPIEACRIIDAKLDSEADEYIEAPRHDWFAGTGYFVYEAPADWTPVKNGTDPDEIDRVMALPCVAKVTYRRSAD